MKTKAKTGKMNQIVFFFGMAEILRALSNNYTRVGHEPRLIFRHSFHPKNAHKNVAIDSVGWPPIGQAHFRNR